MAKYTAAQIEAMGKKGQAFHNPDGHYSYPIGDADDLKNAIHAVGRGNADHDALRRYIIGRAKDLNQMDQIPDNWNSDGSLSDASGSLAPLEQRKAVREGIRNTREARRCTLDFELRDVANGTGGTDLLFTGYASVTGDDAAYEMEDFLGSFRESVSVGAFAKTLREKADVPFLLNHQGMTLARTKSGTLKLSEVTEGPVTGLHTEARLDPNNPTVKAMRSAIERGDLDEMSFAFRVTRQRWDWADDTGADMDRRHIDEVSLNQGDVSLVNYGANPHTGGLVAVRANAPDFLARVAVDLGKLQRQDLAGMGKEQLHSIVDSCNALLNPAGEAEPEGEPEEPAAEVASPEAVELARALAAANRGRETDKKRRGKAA